MRTDSTRPLSTCSALAEGAFYLLPNGEVVRACRNEAEECHGVWMPWWLVSATALYGVRGSGAIVFQSRRENGRALWAAGNGWSTDFTLADLRPLMPSSGDTS